MNYNQRLAEIIENVDDRIYKETATAIRNSSINCLDYYLAHNKKAPVILGANVHAFNYGIKKLLEEKSSIEDSNGQTLAIG